MELCALLWVGRTIALELKLCIRMVLVGVTAVVNCPVPESFLNPSSLVMHRTKICLSFFDILIEQHSICRICLFKEDFKVPSLVLQNSWS